MKKLLFVLMLIGVAQPAFAQNMDVWQTKSVPAQSASSGSSGVARRGGSGNAFDNTVEGVSKALSRTSAKKAPRVTKSAWLSGAINGSSDSAGDFLVVARGKYTDLVDNRNPNKPTTRRLAEAYQGGAMGYARISPDGTVALVADDAQKHQVIELETGRVLAEGNANGSRFVGESTMYWWSEKGPAGRRFHHQHENREAIRVDDVLFFRASAKMDYLPCELTRLDWRGGGGAQTITFSDCDSVLSVSEDGKSALLGRQGEVVSLPFSVNQIEQDVYRELVRVDLETMKRTVVARGQFLSPVVSDDLRVVCSNDPETIFEPGDVIVTCYRNGQRIEHRFTAPSEADVRWRSIAVSADGKYFAIRLTSVQGTPTKAAKGVTYIQELGVDGEPLLTISGVGSTTWLPGDRRLLFVTNNGPAHLFDYKAGWRASLGGSKEEYSGVIVLGQRDDQFLLGKERGSTRDMLLVTIGSEAK